MKTIRRRILDAALWLVVSIAMGVRSLSVPIFAVVWFIMAAVWLVILTLNIVLAYLNGELED